tara:strand:+ start:8946 stop:10151 length:1206 start_codon:yes stop_codon:yes gene_type:complete
MGEIITREYSHSLARQFMELVKGNTHRIYAVIGNTAESQTATTPTFTGFSDMKSFWDSAAGFKRITSSDVSMVVPHGTGTAIKEWSSGQGYAQYSHSTDLFTSPSNPFVAFRDSGSYIDVYKCLFNNSDATSTTGSSNDDWSTTSALIRNTAGDGYFWKYMYSFSDTSVFYTTDTNFKWMPVQTLKTKPSDTINLRQWNVQVDAVDGAVDIITHSASFANYTVGENVTLTSTTGSSFAGKIAQIGGTNKRYVDTQSSGLSEGSGYREVSAVKVNNVTDNSLSAVISPISGHGFDAERELGAKDVMVTAKITNGDLTVGTGSGEIPRYATVGLILDPIISGSSQDDVLASGTTISSGTRASGGSYITSNMLKYSGRILYIDKRATITRNASNTDTLRIVLQF